MTFQRLQATVTCAPKTLAERETEREKLTVNCLAEILIDEHIKQIKDRVDQVRK